METLQTVDPWRESNGAQGFHFEVWHVVVVDDVGTAENVEQLAVSEGVGEPAWRWCVLNRTHERGGRLYESLFEVDALDQLIVCCLLVPDMSDDGLLHSFGVAVGRRLEGSVYVDG